MGSLRSLKIGRVAHLVVQSPFSVEKKRIIEDEGSILFHAPYFSGKNEYGKRDIDCEVGQDSLDELKSYYRKITDPETGDRLFGRTMWYCSAEDGWVVTGGAAAELYGIATER